MKIPLILALAASAAFAQAADWTQLAGDMSRVGTAKAVVVADAQAWSALWKEHAGDQPAPAVDFSKEKVVAVFLGQRDRTGYKVELEAASDPANAAGLLVTYGVRKPSGFGATMVTTPFLMKKVAAPMVRLMAKGDAPKPLTTVPAQPKERYAASEAARNMLAAAGGLSALRDAPNASAAFDGANSGARFVPAGLPPPPGAGSEQDSTRGGSGKPLPPPPGQRQDPPRTGGKPLPPPPGQHNDGGKPLPPPPGGGKPLPPPPGVSIPRPTYPGGPLPKGDHRLEAAERTYSVYGLDYVGYWYAGTSYERTRGVVKVTPADAGKTFVLNMTSSRVQEYVEFYRNPQTNEYFWAPDSQRIAGGVRRRLEVSFGPRTLLPWETESFSFALEGRDLAFESQDGAYTYTLTTTTDPRDPESVAVTLNPGAKRLTAPDANGLSARLVDDGGRLKLVIEDRWASEYQGETYEVAAVVRKDDGSFWRRDPVVFSADSRQPLRGSGRLEFDVAGGSGKFYLESWSFRRAGSKLSSGGWVNKGQGNTVSK
ncbi:MAG: hypothetical protein HY928_04270 [Elusimicrobia bacterium]|nr:hypothetical protein [Elusimicrobiota bacterium]